jgi:phosphotransferase system enzyme I (PtsI)
MRHETPPRRTGTGRGSGRRDKPEQVLEGVGVADGLALGAAFIVDSHTIPVPEYAVEAEAVPAELARFAEALARSQKQVRKLKAKSAALPAAAAEELNILLDAHLQMLSGSRVVRGVQRRIAEDRVNAEAAVQAEIARVAADFADLNDSYLAARAEDVREVGRRLIRSLTQTPFQAFSQLPAGSIVISEELTPADTALLDPARVVGFATVFGGAASHTAIMARSLRLPAVLGVAGLIESVVSGDPVLVDGEAGVVIVNPTAARLQEYERRLAAMSREQRQLAHLRVLPAVTRDGTRIALEANLELPRELELALDSGAEGVGLLRTEFLYMNRDDLPGEEEQYQTYRGLIEALDGRPLTMRTLDAGGDKLAAALGDDIGGEANPALGLRATRLLLQRPALLEAQLGAMLRAAAHGPARILLPMISSVSEVVQVRQVQDQVVRRLKRRGVALPEPLPPLGIMIEIPGAALAADALAEVSDFFAIGTNDLTMYTLAIDRGEEQVAHLYDPLHPAVLRLMQFTTEAALRARIPVSVCGEVAGDPRFAVLLLGLGIRELSMSAARLPRVKQRIRAMDLAAAQRGARIIMEQSDSARIAELLDEFNAA